MKLSAAAILVLAVGCGSVLGQTGEIPPAENLVVQGVPKIPAALAEDVARYTEFRSAGFTS